MKPFDLIILAAGRGSRLFGDGPARPKCLVEIGGQTILDRWLSRLSPFYNRAIVVTGFDREAFAPRPRVTYIENEEWATTNTAASLVLAFRARFHCTDNVLIINGDVIATDHAIRAIVRSIQAATVSTVFAIPCAADAEAVKVAERAGFVDEIGKHIEQPDAPEAIGINYFTNDMARNYCGWYTENYRMKYFEDLLNDMTKHGRFIAKAAMLPESNVIEIDTPADLERAQRMIGR